MPEIRKLSNIKRFFQKLLELFNYLIIEYSQNWVYCEEKRIWTVQFVLDIL